MSDGPRFRRPASLDPAAMEFAAGGTDPAQASEAAHETARVLVGAGRASDDPQLRSRLVGLVDELGLTTVADLWSRQPARSLPGALWRLYSLREWIQRDSLGASADYDAGRRFADVSHVVAGAADPPGPNEIKDLGDAILRGVFEGDFAVALERAAAFCDVVAAGRAHRADSRDGHDDLGASADTRSASNLFGTAADLRASAGLWRAGRLD